MVEVTAVNIKDLDKTWVIVCDNITKRNEWPYEFPRVPDDKLDEFVDALNDFLYDWGKDLD